MTEIIEGGEETQTPFVHDTPTPDQQQPTSMMNELRKRREQATTKREVEIPIGGYDGLLVARYRLLDGKELQVIGERVRRQVKDDSERTTLVACDVLVAACTGLWGKDEDQYVPIDPDDTGETAKFDMRAAQYFGFDAQSARDCVLGVFAGNEVALVSHQIKLGRWFNDTSRDVNDGLLGEL